MNTQTPDSASTASAMFSGVKTNYETFGFDNSIVNDDPFSESTATKVETILKWAQDAGMDTGTYNKFQKGIQSIYSQLSRCSTARGFSTWLSLFS